jgi:hypothetical protein
MHALRAPLVDELGKGLDRVVREARLRTPPFYPREHSKPIECFTELLNSSEAVIETALRGNRDFSVDEVLLPFVSSATAFKHQGFYEEREVRLVAMAGTDLAAERERKAGRDPPPLKDVFKTSRDKRERSHISLFGKDFADLPIKRGIVGPSLSQENNVSFAHKIVGRKLPVSKSATPYIENPHEFLSDFLGQALLNAKPPPVHSDHARKFRYADDLVLAEIADIGAVNERQSVVLTQRHESDRAFDGLFSSSTFFARQAFTREYRLYLRVAIISVCHVDECLQSSLWRRLAAFRR